MPNPSTVQLPAQVSVSKDEVLSSGASPLAKQWTPLAVVPEKTAAPVKRSWRQLYAWFVGILGGFTLMVYAQEYLGSKILPQPVVKVNYAMVDAPANDPVRTLILPLITSAKTEILISARALASKTILTALLEKNKAGVRVAFLLDKQGDVDGRIDRLRRWLQESGFRFIFVDPLPMYNQFIVVDRSRIAFGALPFTAEAGGSSSLILAIEDSALAQKFSEYFAARAQQQETTP